MAQQQQRTPNPRPARELTPVLHGDELVDMREAADVLMEDEGEVAGLLAAANVPLVREAGEVFVAHRDLLAFRDREIDLRREGVREITRLSIAAGLDEVSIAPIPRDR